jgi:hypothetical protein
VSTSDEPTGSVQPGQDAGGSASGAAAPESLTTAATEAPGATSPETPGGASVAPPVERRPSSRRRRILVGFLFLLSCLFVVGTSVVVWTHQVALNTDRYVSVVGAVSSDPAVIDTLSNRVATQVVTALDVQGKIQKILPGGAEVLAVPLTDRIRQTVAEKLAVGLATDQFQNAWLEANRLLHTTILKILRGNPDSVSIQNGMVTLDLYALVGNALTTLQSSGIIPASVTLPDLNNVQVPEQARQKVEQALGITLPADFGQIPIVKASGLETARQAVQLFDILTILFIILTLVLIGLTIWLARRRLRMVIYLGVGVVVSLVIARFVIGGIEDAIVSSIAAEGLGTTVRAVLDHVLGNYFALGRVLVVIGIVAAVVAYLAGRPAWLVRATSAASSAAGRGAASAGAVAAGAAGGVPTSEAATGWVTSNREAVRWAIVGTVAFLIVWWVAGFEIAILAAAAVLLGEFLLRYISRRGDDDDESPGTDVAPASPPVAVSHHEQ